MSERPYHVLFLCTHNSARSIMAECVMNRLGKGKFVAHSAGSQPRGTVHPLAIALLERLNYDIGGLRSKSWQEFAAPSAPRLDFVFTVCDDGAEEVCPVWPGQPMSAHWGLADPSRVEGSDAERALAFADTHRMLNQQDQHFLQPAGRCPRSLVAAEEPRRYRPGRDPGAAEEGLTPWRTLP